MKTLIAGDVCPTEVTAPFFKAKDMEALFADVPSVFKGNDLNFVNLECTLTESKNAIKKFGPNLKGPAETAEVLKNLGADLCGLSNNHVFDFGREGMKDTFRALKGAGLDYTGFGDDYEDSRKNYYFEKDGEKIAIIAVCEHEYSYALEDRMGSRPFDEYDTLDDVREARKVSDRVIVIYHGGKEHCEYPSPRLYKLCHAMARAGADLVVCQHSHCIGTYEKYDNCHIVYGEGNFHFSGYHIDWESWKTGLIIKYDTKSTEIEFIPVKATESGIALVKGEEKEKILHDFFERSKALENGEWKKRWHDFCEKIGQGYLNHIGIAYGPTATAWHNDVIGHYLDCEAHTDLLRELIPSYNLTNEK